MSDVRSYGESRPIECATIELGTSRLVFARRVDPKVVRTIKAVLAAEGFSKCTVADLASALKSIEVILDKKMKRGIDMKT